MPPTLRQVFRWVLTATAAACLFTSCAAARTPQDEINRIVELMQLRPGMRVADVGSGRGEFAEALAEQVGPAGHVFATEVDEDDLPAIEDRLEAAGHSNTTVLLGDDRDTGLGEGCCDAILLRLVYHHFTNPQEMRDSLRRALRPGGRLVVIDIRIQPDWGILDGVPDRGGHGIPADRLVEEMTGDGYRVVQRFDDWPGDSDHFCVVFEEDTAAAKPADSGRHPE